MNKFMVTVSKNNQTFPLAIKAESSEHAISKLLNRSIDLIVRVESMSDYKKRNQHVRITTGATRVKSSKRYLLG